MASPDAKDNVQVKIQNKKFKKNSKKKMPLVGIEPTTNYSKNNKNKKGIK